MNLKGTIKIEWFDMGRQLSKYVKDEAFRAEKILIKCCNGESSKPLKPQKDCVRIACEDVPLGIFFKAWDAIGWGYEDFAGFVAVPKELTPRFYQDGVEITMEELVEAHAEWCRGRT